VPSFGGGLIDGHINAYRMLCELFVEIRRHRDHHEFEDPLAAVLVEREQRLGHLPVEQAVIQQIPAPCPASVGVPLLRLCNYLPQSQEPTKD
jgi:hypothetical protein